MDQQRWTFPTPWHNSKHTPGVLLDHKHHLHDFLKVTAQICMHLSAMMFLLRTYEHLGVSVHSWSKRQSAHLPEQGPVCPTRHCYPPSFQMHIIPEVGALNTPVRHSPHTSIPHKHLTMDTCLPETPLQLHVTPPPCSHTVYNAPGKSTTPSCYHRKGWQISSSHFPRCRRTKVIAQYTNSCFVKH